MWSYNFVELSYVVQDLWNILEWMVEMEYAEERELERMFDEVDFYLY